MGQVEDGVRKSMAPLLKDEVQFYSHQISGSRRMMTMRNFLLADDMGLGKSLQAITVCVADMVRFTPAGSRWAERVLVVCPVTLKANWSEELEKFTGIPHVILGQAIDPRRPDRLKSLSPADRSRQLKDFAQQSGPRFLIANYEQIDKHLEELNAMNFDIVIFDEAHFLKNHKAKRTQVCHQIRGQRFFMLTGTPMLNNVAELWGLLHLIDAGRAGSPWQFENRYCTKSPTITIEKWDPKLKKKVKRRVPGKIIGVKNEAELKKWLNEVMIRRLKSEVLDLPDVQYIIKKIELSTKQQKLYDQVEKQLEVEMVGLDSPADIENSLTKLLRLKQICGSTYGFLAEDDSAKLDQAVEDAVELITNGHKIVVFTQFRPIQECFLTRLEAALPDAPLWELHGDIAQHDRQPHVRSWSTDSRPGALVCMLQVAGVGLNMTASRHALFLDELWVPGLNQQAVDRLHRIGASETQPIQVLKYHTKGTVETRVQEVLRTKSNLFDDVINEQDYKTKLLKALLSKTGAF